MKRGIDWRGMLACLALLALIIGIAYGMYRTWVP